MLTTTEHNGDVVVARFNLEGTGGVEATHVNKLVKNGGSAIGSCTQAVLIGGPGIGVSAQHRHEAEVAKAVTRVGNLSVGQCERVVVASVGHLDCRRGIPAVSIHLTCNVEAASEGINHGAFANLLGNQIHLLIVGIEGESQVVGAGLGNCVDVVIGRPSIAPVVIADNLEGNRGATGQLNAVLGPGVKAVDKSHLGFSSLLIPSRITKYLGGLTCNTISVDDNGSHITLHLELHGVGVEGELVGLAKGAGKTVGYIAVGGFLGRVLDTGSNCLSARQGTITVVAIERVPVIAVSRCQVVGKNKPHGAIDLVGNIGVDTISIVGHLGTGVGVPVAERVVTHNVHCRIGVQANEGNHHR